MSTSKSTSFLYKLLSLLSVIRGYNILVLILAQYLAAIFIFSPKKSLHFVLLDYQLLLIVLASVCVVSSGYIINNFYDVKADIINRPIKASLDNVVSQKIKLQIYFLLNFLGFIFGFLISWRASLFFAVYIFAIWLYSHKLKKHPFIGLVSAAVLTILPFFAIFVHYKNFSKIIFVHASFLFFVLLLRQLIKDLENLRGAIVNNYTTFPVKYGERNTRKLGIVFIVFTFFPIAILLNYPGVGYMKYYFFFSLIILIFIGYFLWKSNLKRHYVFLHNILKIMLLLGILSLLFIDPSLVIERVIDKLN
ncbi:hypothetical protein KCTC32516_01357 [Polaribacter huanghezhanensis]|uniref:geranylgeranylglycerol-phosphate geranylgeranyltransferase n=1 Tax=Polaribacter huanghezhanensis TaxID=1354726 RepID=UPI0026488C83|nr:geranylgeranylglycerol-phosphate geranylgeranyltransferase [Polaribacter huanghezhanensis]WKD86007.1 hypothetical protein KCTC32516_01357 [Polaribacter huanghezhanensis]